MMKRIDVLNERIEACGCFTDSMTSIAFSEKTSEYLLEADPLKAGLGVMTIRGNLLHTQFSDELIAEDDSPNTLTFVLNRKVIDGELVNAFIKLTRLAGTSYKIVFCVTSKIMVTSDGKEYLV